MHVHCTCTVYVCKPMYFASVIEGAGPGVESMVKLEVGLTAACQVLSIRHALDLAPSLAPNLICFHPVEGI